MPPRKKTLVERFLSLNQHLRRRGGSRVSIDSPSYSELENTIVKGDSSCPTWGSTRDLTTHLKNLRMEFVGRSELELHHANLVVLLRRRYKLKETYTAFHSLWDHSRSFLLDRLNLRWLVSAADSIADYDPDPTQRSIAVSVSLLVNTVKLCESERFLCASEDRVFVRSRVNEVQTGVVPLVEGMSCFTAGTDDTLRNLLWRVEAQSSEGLAGSILKTCFQRIQECETVYSRFRHVHTRSRTSWWEDHK